MLSIISLALSVSSSLALESLVNTNYNIKDVSVSGLSSGAYMAVQFQVAFSSLIKGAAIFAGGPFYCAEDNLIYAEYRCMQTTMGKPNVASLVALTETDATKKFIDPTSNMKNHKVYIYSGSADSVISQTVVKSLQDYYQYFMSPDNIVADYDVKSEHCLPTLSYGEKCDQLTSPYIGKCNFDGAYYALSTIYGMLVSGGVAKSSNLKPFDQTAYFKTSTASIGKTGYIYVPTSCQAGAACSLHVSFHGCEQDIASIGNSYAANTGFNDWAELNNIIVVYPYVVKSYSLPSNPNGCWDWWGYTDGLYGVQAGVQMQFVKAIIDDLMKN